MNMQSETLAASCDANEIPGRVLTYKEAIKLALAEAMAEHPKSFALGQDIAGFSILGITDGLTASLGAPRVRDCPIAESAMVGMAVGAAMRGYVAMIEFAYADISAVAFSSIVHSAAKLRYASNGALKCPMLIRSPIGRWSRHGPMGTEVTASWYMNVPDLAVAMPSTPGEAYWQLKRAFTRDVPTMFLEDKGLYGTSGVIEPMEDCEKAHLVRSGDDLTIIAAGRPVQLAQAAAEALAKEGIGARVLSLGHVKPFDEEAVVAHARSTGRVIVVQDEPAFGGYGPIVQSVLARLETGALRQPPRLIAREDSFLPYVREEDHLCTAGDIVAAAREMMR